MFKAFLDKQGEVASRFVSSRQFARATSVQVVNYAYAAMASLCAGELMYSIHDQVQSLISKDLRQTVLPGTRGDSSNWRTAMGPSPGVRGG
jgi:hypothetical protein